MIISQLGIREWNSWHGFWISKIHRISGKLQLRAWMVLFDTRGNCRTKLFGIFSKFTVDFVHTGHVQTQSRPYFVIFEIYKLNSFILKINYRSFRDHGPIGLQTCKLNRDFMMLSKRQSGVLVKLSTGDEWNCHGAIRIVRCSGYELTTNHFIRLWTLTADRCVCTS